MGDPLSFIFAILVLILSVIAHEISHGYAAESLGDPTARLAGRLTLDPRAHLDLVGSFIVPTLTFFLGGFIIGWAKPVPYNPHNLRGGRFGEVFVAASGALTNLAIAVIFGLFIRFGALLGVSPSVIDVAGIVVFLNILLAFFNLLPIPPLDGSKVLFGLLPYRFYYIQQFLERYWIFAILVLIFFLWELLIPIVFWLFTLLTGTSFF